MSSTQNVLSVVLKRPYNLTSDCTTLAHGREACKVARKVERALATPSNRPNFTTKGWPPQAHSTTQTLKVQKVSPAEMEERRKQGLCYYYDEKYSPGHKCKEPKFFQIDATDHSSSEEAPPLEEPEEE